MKSILMDFFAEMAQKATEEYILALEFLGEKEMIEEFAEWKKKRNKKMEKEEYCPHCQRETTQVDELDGFWYCVECGFPTWGVDEEE